MLVLPAPAVAPDMVDETIEALGRLHRESQAAMDIILSRLADLQRDCEAFGKDMEA